jgi:hypothetical protein
VGLYAVCMCERGGWGREWYGLRNVISTVTEPESYILRYISLTELGTLYRVGFARSDAPVYMCEREC